MVMQRRKTMTKGMVNLELSKEDSALFVRFREVQDTFIILEASGVFNIRNGHATLNFNQAGVLDGITGNVTLYKRGLTAIPVLVDLRPRA